MISGRVAAIAAIAALACGDAAPQRTLAAGGSGLSVYDALAPASAAPDVASLYFAIENAGELPDTLLGVATPAGSAMLHDVITDDAGRTRMEHVMALEIPPGSWVRLAPGSYHVMITGLAQPLAVGDTIAVALAFARADTLRFRAPVLTYTEVVQRLERHASR
jgi:copper(I)-binding protein